jgi:CRISPR-associated protein Cas2
VTNERLARLKHDMDRVTDSYDRARFYQYPLDDTLVITDLETKKWRRKKIVF